ncbi:uncharacterized protein LOC112018361 isoform X4 [Quercus suber]|uniref:uncharacterized protein LOC112018361 isoform X4 n=1 Tax=Quercus suber TaxID=58331 RepID=UPI0032DF311F
MQSRESGLTNVGGHCQGRPVFGHSFGSTFCELGSPYSFILQLQIQCTLYSTWTWIQTAWWLLVGRVDGISEACIT